MGLHVAMLAMALDPEYVVIGGGLMDPDATTAAFRAALPAGACATPRRRSCGARRSSGSPWCEAALGDLSQAIGAALVALYSRRTARREAAAVTANCRTRP